MFNYAFNSMPNLNSRKLVKFGVVIVACNRGPYIKRISLRNHSWRFNMKAVRKLGDFSVESILADTSLRNDHCKHIFQSAVNKNCEANFSKEDEFEKCFDVTEIKGETGDIKNSFQFANGKPALDLKPIFEVSIETSCETNNMDKSYKFSATGSTKDRDEVHSNPKKSKQLWRNQYSGDVVNREGNDVSCINKNSDAIVKCIAGTSPTHINTHEKQNNTRNRGCVKLITERKLTLTKVIKSKEEQLAKNVKQSRSEENLRKKEEKQLKSDPTRDFFKEEINCASANHSELLENRDECLNKKKTTKLKEGQNSCLLLHNQKKESVEICTGETVNFQAMLNTTKLEWLKFTRYKPPKFPRKAVAGRNKRKSSIHPRIPFTTFQLDFLEQKFRNCAYISKDAALDISEMLHLPPNRVKIWFQNRRAREKREIFRNVE